jgi:hypothetical protein
MLTAGLMEEAKGRTIDELEAERDRGLIAVLKARREASR